MAKIIVSGLSGMVGTRFEQMYGAKHEMNNMDLTRGVDITESEAVDTFFGENRPEVIVHLAAFTNVSAAYEQEGNEDGPCYQVNVVGTENVARAAGKCGAYMVHVSTDFVFDGNKEGMYTEEDEPNPIEWYGQTKFWAEERVIEMTDKYVILRIAYPYQAKPVRPDFLANLINKIKDGSLPPQFTNHWVTPTYVDDLANVFDHCIKNKPVGVYHAVGSSWHTDHQIAVMVKEALGLSGEVREGDVDEYLRSINRPYQRSLKVSNEKLKRDLGINMKTFGEGLSRVGEQRSLLI